MSVPKAEAKQLVDTYEFMVKHDDQVREHWSFYFEYLKSAKIKKARDEYASFDKFIVRQIKSGEIPNAQDLRDKLPVICAGHTKTLKRYVEGKTDFEEAYERAVVGGGENHTLRRITKFRDWLAKKETEEDLLEPTKTIRDKSQFQLKEIEKRAAKLRVTLEKRASDLSK